MKKIFVILFVLLVCSITVYAATYKVNTSGKVTSPTGTVQKNSSIITPQNVYSNYNSQTYVNTKQALANSIGTIDIVMDYSGSMSYWIVAAKKSMAAIVNQLPSSTKVGFRVFGHNGGGNPYSPVLAKVKNVAKDANGKYKVTTTSNPYLGNTSGSCSATAQVVPVIQHDASALINGMNSVVVGGSTPLTLALEQSVKIDFANLGITSPKKIILITDGGENCGGDPCAFARQLVAKRQDITIDVVLVSASSSRLSCLARETGGRLYKTNDIAGFTNVLTESMRNVPVSTETNVVEPTQNYEFIGE